MQKTQVLKLNTSKDNIEAFFDKMKDKFIAEQDKCGNLQNYDITMIVKHENKGSFKENVSESGNKKSQTLKSILSQSDPNAKYSDLQNDKQIDDIFYEETHIQPNIIHTQAAMNQQFPLHKNKLSKKVTGRKVRDSNKMPANQAMFQFRKKQQTEDNSNIQKTNNYFAASQKTKNKKPPQVEQQSNEDDRSDSQSSQFQQRQEEDLKKNISHRYVDIFPNIQINAIVTNKLFSLKNVNRPEGKRTNTYQHRRCSIDNENLLSPKMRNLVTAEVRQQSTKEINGLLKNKLSNLSSKEENYFSVPDAINQVKEIEEQMRKRKKVKKSSTSIRALQNQEQQNLELQEKEVQTRPKHMNKTRDRVSAMAKRSIFQGQQPSNNKISNNKISSNKTSKNRIQFTEAKISEGYVINVPNTDQNNHILNSKSETSSDEDQKSSSSSNEQPEESIHVIENKLNDCIGLIDKNELSSLQDFLYDFKNKYFYVSSTRIQIKWRLLMAHCKENKKEFERAAINYNSVIILAKENPKSLTIEPADVYQRLGVCYSQIAEWNKGILAFTEALNRYKRNKNITKYAECMNNLGALYLQAESINLAEKCFIQSYHLKKSLYGKNTTKLLTSLFNIFQCNLLTKNYDQAQKVIQVIQEQIIQKIPQKQSNRLLYLGGLYRRQGKMQFLRGKINSAEQNYLKAFQMLSHKYPYCMEFGELMSCLGILKLQDKKYKEAKQYYDKAIMLMNFYCPKDSRTILTLKKNLQYTVKMIMEEREGSSSRRSGLD